MALPIEPASGLFPDPKTPPFTKAPELGRLTRAVMAQWPEFAEVLRGVEEAGIKITYLFETRPFDPLADEYKRHVVAKVTKASPLWFCICGSHLVIQFRQWFWDKYSPEQREAVVYHELKHIKLEFDPEEVEPPKLSLRPHDLEEFYGVARRYGTALPDIANLVKVHGWWAQEQPDAALAPGRSVDVETGEITEGTVEPNPLDEFARRIAALPPDQAGVVVDVVHALAKEARAKPGPTCDVPFCDLAAHNHQVPA